MNKAKIIFASDWAPIRGFSQIMKENPEVVYGDLLSNLQNADYCIVNMEAPLCCPDGLITKSGAAFSGEAEHIHALKAGNFKAVVCANNHTFDSGPEGFRKTQQILRENHISSVGAGENITEARKELSFEINGIKFALFAVSEGEDMLGATDISYGVRPWETEKLAEEIRQVRPYYDIILVSAHCGLEYQPYPSFYVYEAFELWAEAGADMGATQSTIQTTIVDPTVREWKEVVQEVNETLKVVAEKSNGGDSKISAQAKAIIASYLGENNKITEASPSQQELVEAALVDLKALVAGK